ncbi:MAG: trypsin-like peptidase domain-containing protein [Chloroflexi bacterium]|nr:trypsin-like peptidase domain-containing protein [Chloroflexota bacterium]MCY4248487.1 trypsin-like peptidase domain-containing protein [Chloroflexota bacterium]
MPKRVFCAMIFCMLAAMTARGQAARTADLDRLKQATVFLYQARAVDNNLLVRCISSGTLISADGLIITNAHSLLPSRQCDGDTIIVALNVVLDEPPIPKYRADIARAEAGLDIALLRITRQLDNRPIASESLPVLPFVEIGDSTTTAIDDNLLVLGYPELGDQAVSVARGTVTALIAEPSAGGRSWFKTRAELPGTMSGGGAYDTAGRLIGIPTNALSAGRAGSCRYLSDSNGDNLVNSNDHCVPIGDFISAIRPVHLAQSAIRGARLGLDVRVESAPAAPPSAQRAPAISRLFFAPSIVDGLPASVVGSLPTNTRSLYLFFDYANMTPETIYELRVVRDGVPDRIFSLPPLRWSGGERGLWHIGAREQAWANGAYEFTLLVDGASVASQQIVIGGAPETRARFSNIVFGTLDRDNRLVGNGSIVPIGSIASARFLYANLRAGAPWSAIWYYEGAEVARTTEAWSDDDFGSKSISVAPQGGLLPGQYRLELYIEGALSATSDFIVAGASGGPLPLIFSNLRFAAAGDRLATRQTLAAGGAPSLYALFDWRRIASGTPWTVRWLVDDQAFFQVSSPWQTSETGAGFAVSLADPPDGKYTIQLLINNLKLAEAETTVGIGQLPLDRFADFAGTVLSGTVIDAATERGISGVTIVLISEDYAASEFVWREDQIVALATTDRRGRFQFARPLAFDTFYSVVIEADGYIPHAADEFLYEPDQPFADIRIEMVRGS